MKRLSLFAVALALVAAGCSSLHVAVDGTAHKADVHRRAVDRQRSAADHELGSRRPRETRPSPSIQRPHVPTVYLRRQSERVPGRHADQHRAHSRGGRRCQRLGSGCDDAGGGQVVLTSGSGSLHERRLGRRSGADAGHHRTTRLAIYFNAHSTLNAGGVVRGQLVKVVRGSRRYDRAVHVQCAVAGGGPAGMMLGFLLARAGVDVVVLEKHADFLRDFRGDTIHPSTLELHPRARRPRRRSSRGRTRRCAADAGTSAASAVTIADFSHLPTRCKFIALMPQWDFLDFLADAGEALSDLPPHDAGRGDRADRERRARRRRPARDAGRAARDPRRPRRRRRRPPLDRARAGRPAGRRPRRADRRALDARVATRPTIRRRLLGYVDARARLRACSIAATTGSAPT